MKTREALTIHTTYRDICNQLHAERLEFDKRLDQMRELLNAKSAERGQLEAMHADAERSRQVARTELEQFEQQLLETRRENEQRLAKYRAEVKERLVHLQKMEKRREQEETQRSESLFRLNSTVVVDGSSDQRLADFEQAVLTIREATGLHSLAEIVDRFCNHDENNQRLQRLRAENIAKIAELKAERDVLMRTYDDLKYSAHHDSQERQTVVEFEERVRAAEARLKTARIHSEREALSIVQVAAGLDHLVDRLGAMEPAGQGSIRARVSSSSDSAPVEILQLLEVRLGVISDRFQDVVIPSDLPLRIEQPMHNVRIVLPKPKTEVESLVASAAALGSSSAPGEGEESDEELDDSPDRSLVSRELMKRQHEAVAERLAKIAKKNGSAKSARRLRA
jgi:hypothetical protein